MLVSTLMEENVLKRREKDMIRQMKEPPPTEEESCYHGDDLYSVLRIY